MILRDLLVAEERTPLALLVDSGINPEVDADEATVEIAVDTPQEFEGGAEVIDDGQGGAIVQALMEQQTEVMAEPYDHNANIAEALDEGTLGELSSIYERCLMKTKSLDPNGRIPTHKG